jgi:hypothetical protein
VRTTDGLISWLERVGVSIPQPAAHSRGCEVIILGLGGLPPAELAPTAGGDEDVRTASTGLPEQGTQPSSPAPDFISSTPFAGTGRQPTIKRIAAITTPTPT